MAKKSIFKRWTGTAWEEFYFKTSADLIDETATYKVLTATERTAISTYLTNFNGANELVKLDGSALIPSALIPTNLSAYLKTNNPTFTGVLTGPTIKGTLDGTLTLQAQYTGDSNASSIVLGNDTMTFNLGGGGQSSFFTYSATQQQGVGEIDLLDQTVLTGLLDPTSGTDAANKQYVDALVSVGLRWAPGGPVEVASTTNIPSLSGLLTIDGVTLTAGQRVLVYNQDTTSQNGIYIVASGAWEKVLADSAQGIMVFVMNGDTHNDWTFQNTNGTTWIETSKVDTYLAGAGITKTGLTFSISSDAITNAMLAGSISLADKTAAFTALDNANASYDTWGELTAASTSENITVKLNNLYAAIGLARGTANYNTNNAETIAGAYDLAEVKNRTYTGTTSEPTGLTLVAGDLYFYELA